MGFGLLLRRPVSPVANTVVARVVGNASASRATSPSAWAWTTPSSSARARTGSRPPSSSRARARRSGSSRRATTIGGGIAHRRADAAGLRARRLLGLPSDGRRCRRSSARCRSTAHGLALDPSAGVGRASARRASRRCCCAARSTRRRAALGEDAQRLPSGSSRRSCASRTALLADLLGPLRHPAASDPDGALRPAGPAARDGAASRPLPRAAGARAARRLRRAFDPAARATAHRARSAMIFALTAHVDDWPVAAGGSQAIGRRARLVPAPRSAAASRPACTSARSPTCRRRASSSSTRARRSSPTSASPVLPARLRAPAPPLSLRPRRLQARLGARRTDPVARPALPRGVDGAPRRHARGDRRRRGRGVARRASRAAVRARRAAEPVRPDARAGRASTPATPTVTCRRARPSI